MSDQAQHWAAMVAEAFQPKRYVLDDEMRRDIRLVHDLMNQVRFGCGEPLLTLDEAFAERQAEIDSGEYAIRREQTLRDIAEADARQAAEKQAGMGAS